MPRGSSRLNGAVRQHGDGFPRKSVTTQDHELLARRFETHRPRLRAVAYRMLGSRSEADDAVQEAWLRLSRTTAADIDNFGGWLTTVVSRICLDHLRSRETRREEEIGIPEIDATPRDDLAGDPARAVELADSVGAALLVVLETLDPAERLAFVLHDLFGVSFDEIAPIVGRSNVAARQLASRARRRVQGAPPVRDADISRQRAVVAAFLTASREGDFAALLELLDPEARLRADDAVVAMGGDRALDGRHAVAKRFAGQARGARLAIVDGAVALVWAPGGAPRVIFAMTVADGQIVDISMIADPDRLATADVQLLDQ
jgi:RNA polymerase sigma-70 factor (ECF subfamily)